MIYMSGHYRRFKGGSCYPEISSIGGENERAPPMRTDSEMGQFNWSHGGLDQEESGDRGFKLDNVHKSGSKTKRTFRVQAAEVCF
jgi:hypothetical protein